MRIVPIMVVILFATISSAWSQTLRTKEYKKFSTDGSSNIVLRMVLSAGPSLGTLPVHIGTRELKKFTTDVNSNIAVRVVFPDGNGSPTTNEFAALSNRVVALEEALAVTSNQVITLQGELTAVSNQVQDVDAALTVTSNQLVTATNDLQVLTDDLVALTNGNFLVGGTLQGGLNIISLDVGVSYNITSDDAQGSLVENNTNAAQLITYPTPVKGKIASVANTIFDVVLTVAVTNVLHTITLDGVVLAPGNKIESSGDKNDAITLYAQNSTNWITKGRAGTWIDGGP